MEILNCMETFFVVRFGFFYLENEVFELFKKV